MAICRCVTYSIMYITFSKWILPWVFKEQLYSSNKKKLPKNFKMRHQRKQENNRRGRYLPCQPQLVYHRSSSPILPRHRTSEASPSADLFGIIMFQMAVKMQNKKFMLFYSDFRCIVVNNCCTSCLINSLDDFESKLIPICSKVFGIRGTT